MSKVKYQKIKMLKTKNWKIRKLKAKTAEREFDGKIFMKMSLSHD
jgi:hypothetical protein